VGNRCVLFFGLALASSPARGQTCASQGYINCVVTTPNWLPAATSGQTVTVAFLNPPASFYEILGENAIGIRWNSQILPGQSTLQNVSVTFSIPAALLVPGITEFVLWNSNEQQPLPYSGWIPVIIPTAAQIFEADPVSGQVAAAVGADGTGTGTGGQITIYQLSTGVVTQSIPVLQGQRVLAFTPDTAYAWVAENEAQGQIARLNLSTGAVDQPIQITGGSPPYSLTAQVYRANPAVLIVSVQDQTGTGKTWAYANGSLLPNPAPGGSLLPFGTDDTGRFLMANGQACVLDPAAGFTNCVSFAPYPNCPGSQAAWQSKWFCNGSVYDLTTGDLLLSVGGYMDTASYLLESDRVLFNSAIQNNGLIFADASSLEIYTSLDLSVNPECFGESCGQYLESDFVSRVWAPDWILAELSYGSATPASGILVGEIPQLAAAPVISSQGVANAATLAVGSIAPGEIVSIFGQNLGPAAGAGPVLDSLTQLATSVEQTQAFFNGEAGAILYAGAGQVNAVVPESVEAGETVEIQIVHYGIPSSFVQLQTVSYSPALFGYPLQGQTYAAALNANGVLQGPSAPLRRGAPAVFYATGLGLPPGEAAEAVAARAEQLSQVPSITIGGEPAQVTYAGLAPGLTAGLTQINVQVPNDAPTGVAVEVVIAAGTQTQGNVWVAVQ
jgi:uncharacterized protein (TIGR03437 family)